MGNGLASASPGRNTHPSRIADIGGDPFANGVCTHLRPGLCSRRLAEDDKEN